MRSRFTSQSGAEALFNEPDTAFSAQHPDGGNDISAGYTQNEGALTQVEQLVSVLQVVLKQLTLLH